MASSVSEQIAELSADLLLRAAGDLAQITYNAGMMLTSVGNEALVALINSVSKDKLSKESKEALDKIKDAVSKGESAPRQLTVLDSDRKNIEKWLKKQDVLYAAVRNDNQGVVPGFEKSVIVFLEKDSSTVEDAIALANRDKGLINELPATAFLFALKEEKEVPAVVGNVNADEIELFRELAKEHGLVYSVMFDAPSDNAKEKTGKILISNKDVLKAAAALQMVSWSMTGKHAKEILEKIKERISVKGEIQKLIANGVEKGKTTIQVLGKSVTVENAKYIVNQMLPHQYLKVTNAGFVHFKFGKEVARVSKDDPEYNDKLQLALGEFSGAVVFDAEEWEKEGLDKANARKQAVKKRISVFPPNFDKDKEASDMQKARKHKKEHEPLTETVWLFDRYDAERPLSEVYQVNYGDPSLPPEETVSVHYGDARAYSQKYAYTDLTNDEKAIDNIIEAARQRSGEKLVQEPEKEVAL